MGQGVLEHWTTRVFKPWAQAGNPGLERDSKNGRQKNNPQKEEREELPEKSLNEMEASSMVENNLK